MPPEQPLPGPASPAPHPYEFIVNYGSQPSSRFSGASASSTKRIAIVAVGGIVLILLAVAFIAFLSGGSGTNTSALVTITQRQSEMVRVAQLVSQNNSAAQSTQNFAMNMQLTLDSEQQTFLKFLRARGIVPSQKTLAPTSDSQTDATLQTAQTNGTYDQAYASIAQAELGAYEQSLSQTFNGSHDLSERQLLKSAYMRAQLLTKQSQQSP